MLIKSNRILFLIFLILFLGGIFFIGSSFLIPPKVIEVENKPAELIETINSSELSSDKTINIFLVGDIMLNRGVEYMIKNQGKGDYRFPFLKIAPGLKKADILFGNLEGPISDRGTKVGSIYSFRADPKAVEGLIFAGFDILSLANNHAFDYGKEALEDTFSRLKNAGIDYVGAGFNEDEAYFPIIKQIEDTKIAFLAYTNLGPETWKATPENSGIAWISEENIEKIKKEIEKVKNQTDILIVSLHSGEEYLKEPTRFQIEFAKAAIDAGADLVIGHHPHIIQKNENYKDGYIFYSLGNFVFDQGFSQETLKGQMLEVVIESKKIKEINQKEIKINNYFQPTLNP